MGKKNKKKRNKNNEELDIKKSKNRKENKKNKFSKRHPKLTLFLRLILIAIILLVIAVAGVIVAFVYNGLGDDLEIKKEDLVIAKSNSVVLDKDGNVVAELSGDERRKIITLDQMAKNLPKAYIAIEDERFYEHNGVDLKRTGAAIFSFITHAGNSSFGGSSITQQLVKNVTKDDQDSGFEGMTRKIKEWAKAYQIEKMLTKDQILELYLNIIFVGGNNSGVEIGANYYFNKSAADLDLVECAFLAGINKGPNLYNPYGEKGYNQDEKKKEKINARTKTVINQMLKCGYISQEEHDQAFEQIDNGITFTKGTDTSSIYSYHTDATIAKVIEDVSENKGISKALATTYVYSSGLTIYSTQDTNIQNKMNEEMLDNGDQYKQNSKKGTDENGNQITTQSSMAIIDNGTGYAIALVGGLGEKTESRGLNRATQSPRQTGSSIKPLTSLMPGIHEHWITAATIYDDCATEFPKYNNYNPKDYNAYKGLVSIRSATMSSQNIPFVKVVAEMTPEKSKEYLKRMGVTTIDDEKDGLAALAIGGFTNGITTLEMAAAYATIANDGVYRTPLLYTKVTDMEGKVVLEPQQKTEEVVSPQTAYLVKDILKSVVQSGTATYCKISGMDVAAKTGSTNNYYDRWLCGFTNYYSGATWYGYDENEEVRGENNYAGKIWAAVMKNVHSGMDGSKFNRPDGIVSATICRDSGKKATDKCTNTYSEIFVEGSVPDSCDAHENSAEICDDTGLLANEYCPHVSTQYFSYTVEKERLGLWNNKKGSVKNQPTEHCNVHSLQNTTKVFKAPTINVLGEREMTLKVGDKYVEKGATAVDDVDGNLTNKIETSGSVNTTKAGKYEITYKVKNSKGKETVAKRTVIVKENDATKPTTNTNSSKPANNTNTNTNSNTNTNTATNTNSSNSIKTDKTNATDDNTTNSTSGKDKEKDAQ